MIDRRREGMICVLNIMLSHVNNWNTDDTDMTDGHGLTH